jgi:hypothetical protein
MSTGAISLVVIAPIEGCSADAEMGWQSRIHLACFPATAGGRPAPGRVCAVTHEVADALGPPET